MSVVIHLRLCEVRLLIISIMYQISETVSQRGNAQIICENYKFSFNYVLSSGETRWRCTLKSCKAFLLTVGEGKGRTLSSGNFQHNHVKNSDRVLQRQHLSALAKRKAVEEPYDRPSKILCSVLQSDSENIKLSDLKCIKENMYAARRKLLPALPTNIIEVQEALESLQPKTNKNEHFLLQNSLENNIVIFSTKTNMQCLCNSEILYMDGTFDYCTKYFLQLFTIHGFYNGHYIPLVFCLLKDKSELSYKKCFEMLLQHISKNGYMLNPKSVVADYEKAIHNAARYVWPDCQILGCRFHLTQAWWRKIQQLGLTSEYKNKNSEIGQWLGYCFGLLFLNPETVSDFFVFELCAFQPQNEKLQKFADYLVDNYISEEAHFPPEMWASNSAALNLTTNACESFHSRLNNSFYQSHPSLFVFVDTLLTIQTEIYVKINSIGEPYKYQNAYSKQRQMYLNKHISNFQNGTITTLQFVKLASHYYSNTI